MICRKKFMERSPFQMKSKKRPYCKAVKCYKILALLLVAANILLIVGCDSGNKAVYGDIGYTPYSQSDDMAEYGEKHNPFSALPPKTREQINELGISVDDVISVYDKLALDIVKARYTKSSFAEKYQDYYDSITAQFVSITVNHLIEQKKSSSGLTYKCHYAPFYVKNHTYYPSNHCWFSTGAAFENVKTEEMSRCIYPTTINCDFVIKNELYPCNIAEFGIASDKFEKMMSAFNIENGILTEDEVAFAISASYYSYEIGYKTYEPLVIDRELIKNSNEEQLWALYDLIDSIYLINFEGKTPVIEQDVD